MKNFEQCCRVILQQKFPEKQNAHDGLLRQLANATAIEAADLYRNDTLKGLLDEVRFASNQWQAKSDHETDNANKAAYSTIAYAVGRIGKRIEELLSSSQLLSN